MSAENSLLPRPLESSLHPLQLLDMFLESFEKGKESESSGGGDENAAVAVSPSNNAPGEAQDRALDKRRDHVLRVADFLYGGSILEAALAVLDTDGAICHVCAQPSLRKAFLVRGASRHIGGNVPTNYFCLVPSSKHGFMYCSCRSYFERAKNDPSGLCKHLLALKLMCELECPCREEIVSDAEFSTALLRRMLPRESN